jgi:hypothetical protein
MTGLSRSGGRSEGDQFPEPCTNANQIDLVVDSNPRKQGMFVPGTGQQILSPDVLASVQPSTILLLNAAYRGEIESMLAAHSVRAKLLTQPATCALPFETSVA